MSLDQGNMSPGQRGNKYVNKEGLNLITVSSRSPGSLTTRASLNATAEIAQPQQGWTLQNPNADVSYLSRDLDSTKHSFSVERHSSRKKRSHYNTPPDSSSSSPSSPASTAKHQTERGNSTPPSSLTPTSSRQSFQWEEVSRSGSASSSTGKGQQLPKPRNLTQASRKINGTRHQSRVPRNSSKQKIPSGRSASTSDESSRVPARRPSQRRAMTSTSKMPKDAVTNIQEALALHERSRKIFDDGKHGTSSVEISPVPSIANFPAEVEVTFWGRNSSTPQGLAPLVPINSLSPMARPAPVRMSTEPNVRKRPATSHQQRAPTNPFFSDEHLHFRPSMELQTEVVTHYWTSNETRRREYAAIDKRNKGLRGLLNRLLPKLGRKSTKSRFYDEDAESDAGSVRRYRLRLDEDI